MRVYSAATIYAVEREGSALKDGRFADTEVRREEALISLRVQRYGGYEERTEGRSLRCIRRGVCKEKMRKW